MASHAAAMRHGSLDRRPWPSTRQKTISTVWGPSAEGLHCTVTVPAGMCLDSRPQRTVEWNARPRAHSTAALRLCWSNRVLAVSSIALEATTRTLTPKEARSLPATAGKATSTAMRTTIDLGMFRLSAPVRRKFQMLQKSTDVLHEAAFVRITVPLPEFLSS